MRSKLTALFFLLITTLCHAKSLSSQDIKSLQTEVAQAHQTYLNASFDRKQQALLSLSKRLESVDQLTLSSALGPNTLAVTYIRLGLLAKEKRDFLLAGKYFDQGYQHYRHQDGDMTLEKLVEMTYNLDNFARLYAQ